MIGRTIGKYRIVGQLGRGGAGIVYHAIDETLNRDVAIKTLNPDLADTEVMKRFRAEASILAKLNHPQIATIYDLYRSETDLLMVMEFVRGETLDALAQRVGPMAVDRAAYLLDQMLLALEHAHRAGVVHRDMKPANVMVTDAGAVKIMDFGIARVRGAEQMTMDGRLMGTPAYMPPEQVLGQDVDGRADLYSVGVLYYRLLTGALPFAADTPLAMLQMQILDTPKPMQLARPDLPEWCETIVQRALAKSPADRFQTAEEFRQELGAATGLLATAELAKTFAVTPNVPVTDTIDLSEELERVAEPAGSFVERARSRRGGWAWAYSIAALLVGAAIGASYVAIRRSGENVAMAAAAPPPAALERTEPAVAPPAPTLVPVLPAIVLAPASPRSNDMPSPARPAAVATRPPPTPAPAAYAPRPAPVEEHAAEPSEPAARTAAADEAPLVFETKTLVGTRKPREHDAQLVLANGRITVTSEAGSEYPFYSIPYRSVISISYSRGRDPLWNSPQGPTPVTRGGGTLGRMGIVFARDWIALRTNTTDQFVAMRFDEVLIRRVLLALEERTGRRPELIAEPKEAR